MSSFLEDKLPKQQCRFSKYFSTQKCIVTFWKKRKNTVDTGTIFGAILIKLSKAFDCLNPDFLFEKLKAYDFNLPVLKLVYNYLPNRKEKIQVNDSCSLWQDILFDVLQGSFLGPLLFNIFLADLFFTLKIQKMQATQITLHRILFPIMCMTWYHVFQNLQKICLNGLMVILWKVFPISAIYFLFLTKKQNQVDRVCERCLMIIYNNKQLSINYLIENKSSVSIYERNVQVKVTEICKVSNSFTPPHINYNFELRNEYPYNLKQISQFFDSLIKSVYHRSFSYLGPKVWNSLPNSYKSIDTLDKFKSLLKRATSELFW